MSAVDQNRMPFLESLLVEKNRHQLSFHMPGHKGTLDLPAALTEYLGGGDLLAADLVEINGIIDYLHAPVGALKEAQELAALAYQADHTFFLINGSTVGNTGALMSVSGPGQKVIMPRASHRSVYGGLVLSGAMPVYVAPEYHPEIGYALAARSEVVADLLAQHPEVIAVQLTSPNYYGTMSDTATIREMAHQRGAALVIDEAHGSHLSFHDDLPRSATQLRADLVIQSTHKTQGALTQGSMLHYNHNGFANLARVAQVQGLLQTSSPSSIILASIDAARMQMATQGRQRMQVALELAHAARAAICQIDGLWCYGDDLIGTAGIFAYDPTKLIIRTTGIGYTGFDAAHALRYTHHIDVEFSDLRQIICSVTIGDSAESLNRLVESLRALALEKRPALHDSDLALPPAGLPTLAISPREAYFARSQAVPIEQAFGAVVAENIIPYPPGIPLLVPGEILEAHHLEYLRYIRQRGGKIVGMEDSTLQTVRIVV